MQTDRNDLIEQLGFKGHSWDYMCGIMPIVSGDAIDRMGTAAAPELAHLLADPDAKTRYAAAEFLSRFGVHDEKYIGGWLAQAEGFRSRREESVKDRDERKAAERAVSERVVALAGGKLIELLRDKDWKVRRQSVQTLGNLCVTSAVGPLIECLKDEDSDVGWDAVRALGQIGGPKALDALASLLENPGPGRIELAEEAAPIVGGPKAFAFWKTDLRSSAPPRRKAAFDGLRLLGTPEAVDLLIAGLKDDDSSVRFCAAEDLGRLRGPVAARGVEPLIAALRDGDDNLRVAAVRALGYIADRRAVDPLIAELKDSNWHVRGDALEALGRIKDPKSVAPVKAMLKDSDTYVRLEAVTSLAELQPPDLADTVRPMLADTDNIVRDAAARAISKAAKRAGAGGQISAGNQFANLAPDPFFPPDLEIVYKPAPANHRPITQLFQSSSDMVKNQRIRSAASAGEWTVSSRSKNGPRQSRAYHAPPSFGATTLIAIASWAAIRNSTKSCSDLANPNWVAAMPSSPHS